MFGERSLSWTPDSEGKYRVPDTKLHARLQAIPCPACKRLGWLAYQSLGDRQNALVHKGQLDTRSMPTPDVVESKDGSGQRARACSSSAPENAHPSWNQPTPRMSNLPHSPLARSDPTPKGGGGMREKETQKRSLSPLASRLEYSSTRFLWSSRTGEPKVNLKKKRKEKKSEQAGSSREC